MNDLDHLQSCIAGRALSENKFTEQAPNTTRILSLSESFHNTAAGNILQSPENSPCQIMKVMMTILASAAPAVCRGNEIGNKVL